MTKRIAVSAGHYPAAPGAVWGSYVEHSKTLEWAYLLTSYLHQRGADVFTVVPVGLTSKIARINAANCAVAIEVHFNSDSSHTGKGSETLYAPGSMEGSFLADTLQRAISTFCAPNRGAKEGWYKMDPAGGVKLAFLAKTNCTALIVEPYFIHEGNKIDANAMIVCDIIAGVLVDYLATK